MKRKNLLVLMSAVLVLLLVTSGCVGKPAPSPAAPSAAEQPEHQVWRLEGVFAPPEQALLYQPWVDQLEKALGGRVTIELYSAGELMPFDQYLGACQAGTVEWLIYCGPACAAPIDTVFFDSYPPFGWQSPLEEHTLFSAKGLGPLLKEAYEELGGIHYIAGVTSDPIHLISSRPISTYEDLKGLKISCDKTLAFPFEEAGATAVLVPFEDLYLAGTTGIVDAIIWCGAKEATTSSWNEPFPYFMKPAVNGAAIQSHIINKELWDSLPSDWQAIIEMAVGDLSERQLVYYYEGECACQKNFTITTMDAEGWAKLGDSAMRKWEELAQTSPRVAKIVQILKDYNAEVEAVGWWR